MRFTLVAGAGLAVALSAGIAQAQSGADDPERNWAAIARCAAIGSAAQRHACMDDVVRRAGVLDPVRVAQAERQDFGREARAEAPRPPARSAPTPAPAPVPVVDEIATTVRGVRTVGFQRLRVTTAEGSVWEQTQAEDFPTGPRIGDAFVIERTTLGGYRCRFGRSSRYYCQRMD